MAVNPTPIRTQIPANGVFIEMGTSGLRHYTGAGVREEFLRDLQGRAGTLMYREMRENHPIIGAMFFAIEMLLAGVDWTVESFSASAEDQERADYLQSILSDLENTWQDVLSEILTMLTYGFAPMEMVFKRRVGPLERDPSSLSKYDDGLIGLRKLSLRPQDSIEDWLWNERGEAIGFIQRTDFDAQTYTVPLSKCLLFRTSSIKNNPEGRSVLRSAYTSYYYQKRLQEIEAIGIERNMAGLPVMRIPIRAFNSTDPMEQAVFAEAKRIVSQVRADEQTGLVLPGERDQNGEYLYDFSLLSAGGASSKTADVGAVIGRYDKYISMTTLADFILLGHEKVGSFALSDDKTDLFAVALGGFLGKIEQTLQRNLVPILWRLNGFPMDRMAQMKHGDIERRDVTQLIAAIKDLSGAGMTLAADPGVEAKIRDHLDLPAMDDNVERVVADETEKEPSEKKPTNPALQRPPVRRTEDEE